VRVNQPPHSLGSQCGAVGDSRVCRGGHVVLLLGDVGDVSVQVAWAGQQLKRQMNERNGCKECAANVGMYAVATRKTSVAMWECVLLGRAASR